MSKAVCYFCFSKEMQTEITNKPSKTILERSYPTRKQLSTTKLQNKNKDKENWNYFFLK